MKATTVPANTGERSWRRRWRHMTPGVAAALSGLPTATAGSSRWLRERRTATVSMHLGYGEKDDMPQKLKGLYEGLAQNPALQNMFTLQNR
jgi:hypothetical protein